MNNPYEAPSANEIPVGSGSLPHAVCLSIGCVVGLHLAIAIDDGIEAAIRRSTGNVYAAMQFYAVVSIISVLLMAVVGRVFRRWLGPSMVSPTARLLSGVLLAFSFYYISTGPSRWGLQTWGSTASMVWLVLSAVLATCLTVVTEAWLMGSRGFTEQETFESAPDLSESGPPA